MIYKCFKRFKSIALNGAPVNVKYGTECEDNIDDILVYRTSPTTSVGLMVKYSENCFNYFLPDSEELGDWTGRVVLYKAIRDKASGSSSMDPSKPTVKDMVFDKIWNDSIANKYRVNSSNDEWMFDKRKLHFATLDDLKHIWSLIKDIKEPNYKIVEKPVMNVKQI